MNIQAGKLYRTRGGGIALIIKLISFEKSWVEGVVYDSSTYLKWFKTHWIFHGQHSPFGSPLFDLIEEVDDPILIAFLKVEYENRSR